MTMQEWESHKSASSRITELVTDHNCSGKHHRILGEISDHCATLTCNNVANDKCHSLMFWARKFYDAKRGSASELQTAHDAMRHAAASIDDIVQRNLPSANN